MATYAEIQSWVKEQHGFTPETCWIAHVKEQLRLPVRRAPNRQGKERVKPCPPGKVGPIVEAFQHFGMYPAGGTRE